MVQSLATWSIPCSAHRARKCVRSIQVNGHWLSLRQAIAKRFVADRLSRLELVLDATVDSFESALGILRNELRDVQRVREELQM